jgi:hypothetical protein
MSRGRSLAKFAALLALTGGLLHGGRAWGADDEMIPEDLPRSSQKALKYFLSRRGRPKALFPAGARVVGTVPSYINLSAARAVTGPALVEHLAEVRPYPATDRKKGPDWAELYWYRPNPKGGAGLTVKRVVDLRTGRPVGPPEVHFDCYAPLTRPERAQAIKLARSRTRKVRDLYAAKGEIEVVALFEQISAENVPDGAPGDRVVNLQFRRRGSAAVVSVNVNVTRNTVREVD